MLYFRMLYAECNGLYAKLHMLDCNMPNAMTIAMSFRMTIEQVGYFVIYISIIRLWLSILPLQEEIAIIPPGLQFISQSLRYFSMPAYHGKEQNFSMPAYVIFCILASIFYILASMFYNPASIFYVPASISYILASISYISGLRYFSLLAHQVIKWYLESQEFQYANISWHEQSFSMPAYHGKSQISVCQHIMASI
jgi:hypothetical protein